MRDRFTWNRHYPLNKGSHTNHPSTVVDSRRS